MRALLAVLVCASGFVSVWTLAPGWDVAQVKLTPGDGQLQDQFGCSVALSSDGTTVVVGAYRDDGPRNQVANAGAAYVYRLLDHNIGTWTQVAKLVADDAQAFDYLGSSVALSRDGTTAVIGASGEDGGPGDPLDNAGAVYVFRLLTPGSTTWVQVAKLTADDQQKGDSFGNRVAISGDDNTVVVAAPSEDGGPGDPLSASGAVYVFRLLTPGSSWTQVAKLTADDAQEGDYLGGSVAVSGDGTTVVAGAIGERGGPGDPLPRAGAAYIFQVHPVECGSWTQVAKLTADDAQAEDQFGDGVAVCDDGTTVVIGAPREDGGPGDPAENAGAAYVFREPTPGSGTWSQVAKLTADDAQAEDRFAVSVAISSDSTTVVIGAYLEDGGPGDPAEYAGAAYVFREPTPGSGSWSQVAKLTADDAGANHRFGARVAISSDSSTVVAGATKSLAAPGSAGAAYLFSGDACPPGQSSYTSSMCAACSVGSSVLGKPCSCDDGRYIDDTQCVDCPQFASRSMLAADSLEDCLCDRGYYHDGASCAACSEGTSIPDSPIGAISVEQCVCDRGYYRNGTVCAACPAAGTSIPDSPINATSMEQCVCDRGYYRNGTVCAACPAGTSITDSPIGAVDQAECIPCSPGQECETVNCDRGEYFNDNDLTCKPCPALTTSEAGANKQCQVNAVVIVVPSILVVLGAAAFVIHKRQSDQHHPQAKALHQHHPQAPAPHQRAPPPRAPPPRSPHQRATHQRSQAATSSRRRPKP